MAREDEWPQVVGLSAWRRLGNCHVGDGQARGATGSEEAGHKGCVTWGQSAGESEMPREVFPEIVKIRCDGATLPANPLIIFLQLYIPDPCKRIALKARFKLHFNKSIRKLKII